MRAAFIFLGGKPADSNNGWIRNMRAIQLGLIDTGSTHSLSVLLSAVEMNLRTRTALEIAQWALAAIISTHVCVPHVLATATVWGWCLFRLELPIVRLLFDGSNYSMMVSNQRNMCYQLTIYMYNSIPGGDLVHLPCWKERLHCQGQPTLPASPLPVLLTLSRQPLTHSQPWWVVVCDLRLSGVKVIQG